MLRVKFRKKWVFIVSILIINIAFQRKRFLNVSVFVCPAYIGYIAVTSNRCYGSEHWESKVYIFAVKAVRIKRILKFVTIAFSVTDWIWFRSVIVATIHCPDQCFVGEMLNNAIVHRAGCYPSNRPLSAGLENTALEPLRMTAIQKGWIV